MLDAYDLLRYTPREALAQIYNDVAGTDIHPREFGEIVLIGLQQGRTQATIELIVPKDKFFPQRRTGTTTLYYNRCVLDEFLVHGVYVPLHLPCTVHDVLNRLQQDKPGLFDLDDFDNAVIYDNEPYRIEAKSSSLRWVGGFNATVVTRIDTFIDINDTTDNPELTILTSMTGRTSINNLVDTLELEFPREL